ncbi:FapA family protein [Herbivorax sp. ANBcel31]|uniref:DUF342 domain-containing protein n=1 Tax=Herbivorax sp. ANBcel31 TaxID=3069754 RepID=UPI0027B639DB|nr:FapA family protein [Herbivorax sp. ANBcel31]MDQ2085688.1 FapA family protein [Herbivorax sp. ANBcel31]
MKNQTIHCNEYVIIFAKNNEVYLETIKSGFSLEQFNEIISMYPYVAIDNHTHVRNVLNVAPSPPQLIGKITQAMELVVSDDELKASLTLHLSKEELELSCRKELTKKVYAFLGEKGISHGIKQEIFFNELKNDTSYTIAEGTPPQHGEDSKIKMYEISEPKPEIKEDGKVNHYNLKLINKVKIGDWLGERINATKGIEGKSVYGTSIPAADGKNHPLKYDRKTVYEAHQEKITLIFSKLNGAVSYNDDGSITVSNHLEIDGDVDFKTGNIKFDGFVTITGIVADGFHVEATKDIEINGSLGLGNIKGIKSLEGNIYIKGGIASKNHVEIKAKKNVFIKFVDNVTIQCGGSAYIGFYCINSNIYAEEVYVESLKGCIIGGLTKAQFKISAPILGTTLEKRTILEVAGFNKNAFLCELDNIDKKINDLKTTMSKIRQALMKADTIKSLTPQQTSEYNRRLKRLMSIKDEIKVLEENKKSISRYSNVKGEGEIEITKRIHPNSCVSIKNRQIEIKNPRLHTTFFFQDGKIREI